MRKLTLCNVSGIFMMYQVVEIICVICFISAYLSINSVYDMAFLLLKQNTNDLESADAKLIPNSNRISMNLVVMLFVKLYIFDICSEDAQAIEES